MWGSCGATADILNSNLFGLFQLYNEENYKVWVGILCTVLHIVKLTPQTNNLDYILR